MVQVCHSTTAANASMPPPIAASGHAIGLATFLKARSCLAQAHAVNDVGAALIAALNPADSKREAVLTRVALRRGVLVPATFAQGHAPMLGSSDQIQPL